jgi:hypothetical protein
MVGFKVFSASLLVALSIAAPLAQISAPVTNPDGSPAGEVGLGNPNGPPQLGPFGQQPGGFPAPPSPPGFEGGFPPQGEAAPPASDEVDAPEAPEAQSCSPRVWFNPFSWLNPSSCSTSGTGEVESSIEIN